MCIVCFLEMHTFLLLYKNALPSVLFLVSELIFEFDSVHYIVMDKYRNPIAIDFSDSGENDSSSDNELCDSELSETESDESKFCEEKGSEQ